MNIKLVEMLQKERDGILSKIEKLKKDLEAYNQLLLVHTGDNDSGKLCNVPGCNAERDIHTKKRTTLCSKHRLEKQSEYTAKHYKKVKAKGQMESYGKVGVIKARVIKDSDLKPKKEKLKKRREYYKKNLKSTPLEDEKGRFAQRKLKREKEDAFVEKRAKEIRKQMFKEVDPPTKEESDKLIKQAKENEY